MMTRVQDKTEIMESLRTANLHAAPGSDGLTSFFYQQCWDMIGDSLTDVIQAIHKGQSPTLSQRTTLMVFAAKPKKPHSLNPNDKRRISLLNADFKILTGIEANRLKKLATHTHASYHLETTGIYITGLIRRETPLQLSASAVRVVEYWTMIIKLHLITWCSFGFLRSWLLRG